MPQTPRRRYIIAREKPSGLDSWIAYANTIKAAREIARMQPVLANRPIRIIHGVGKRYGQIIERI